MKNTIIITVYGGIVQDVRGIPEGVSVQVHDHDTDGREQEAIEIDERGDKYICEVWI